MNDTQTQQRRERKDVQRNLERVLQAAHMLFAARGSEVTMEEVARAAGVGVGTLYRRFPSKAHLLTAVSQAACQAMHQCLAQAAQSEHDPLDKLRALVIVQYERSTQAAALVDPQTGRGSQAEQQQLYGLLHHLLQHIIGQGQQQRVMRPGNPAVLAALCLELIHPRAFHHLQHVVQGGPEEIAEQVVQFLAGGLGATSYR